MTYSLGRPLTLAFVLAPLLGVASGARAATPQIITSTFLGGAGHETVRGVVFASDGSIVASLASYERTVTVSNGMEQAKFTWMASKLIRLDRDAKKVLWEKPIADEVLNVGIDGSDNVFALGKTKLYKLKLSDGAPGGASEAFPAAAIAFSVGASGDVAVLAGGSVVRFDAALTKTKTFNHNIQTPYAVMVDREGGTYVSGDYNPGTGCEPYRVPVLRHFNAAGERDWRFYDYPGQLARLEGAGSRESDSSIRGLSSDARGRLWFLGWSDGLNTMLSQKVWNPKEPNPFLNGACFAGVCPFPRGARTYMMVARLLETYNEVGRATWWQASNQRPTTNGGAVPPEGFSAWLEKFPLCGCRPHPYSTTTSNRIEGVGFYKNEVVIWGGSDKYAPASADAWFGKLVENGSFFVGVLNEDLASGRFGATLPGTTSPVHDPSGAVRGARLVLAGGAVQDLPIKGMPAQGTYGGGASDGFLLLACLGDAAECDAPMPALPQAAAKPVVRPEPTYPELSRCKSGPPLMPAKILSGALPDFGIDYGQAPAPRDGGAPPPPATRDGGAADVAVQVDGAGAGGAGGGSNTGGAGGGSNAGGAGGRSNTGGAGGRSPSPPAEEPEPPPAKGKASSGCQAGPGAPPPWALLVTAIVLRFRRRRRS